MFSHEILPVIMRYIASVKEQFFYLLDLKNRGYTYA